MRILFLFLDGIGLGLADPAINPFIATHMPYLQQLLGGQRLVAEAAPLHNQRASLLSLDATLGVAGTPQSATGQAALLTGQNVPAIFGHHYGPKPDPEVAEFLLNGNLFSTLIKMGKKVGFLNAYPPRYFETIDSGRRMYSAIPLAVTSSGIRLKTIDDLRAGRAISADFTGGGWLENLGIPDIPVLEPFQAGKRLAELATEVDFSLFEYWLSDYAGHRQAFREAQALLETFDQVLGGLLETWDDQEGLILISSDHGNLEDLSTRHHTLNPVPALIVGADGLRREFSTNLKSIADISPAILQFFATPG